ncbi:MAG: glutamate--tRNA ligase, partial [Alphaproteobacteria bacterium]|nr:glutamate--tRNA ligase [Alphaproteobacteria bacterium]
PWRDRDDGDPALPHVVRLRAPQDGAATITDKVQGDVTVQNAELDDFVLLRSDGTPTYMLSVVVDDNDMGVTHVIRGDDHLNNAFRQLALIRSMNWREPVYAHVPLIHGADGAKLSKRHGALGVDAYRDEMGYLPEAVNNYLLRLGWGHGDDEIISREQATEWFDLAHVGRSPSRFDFKKLENLNGHYLREADDARLATLVAPRVETLVGRTLSDVERDTLTRAMDSLKPRAKTLDEIADGAMFLFQADPLPVDEKAAEVLKGAPEGLLAAVTQRLRGLNQWTIEELDAAVRAEAEAAELGLGKLAGPLRAALTGRTVSPGIFDVLLLLGRDVSLARLDAAQHYPAGA